MEETTPDLSGFLRNFRAVAEAAEHAVGETDGVRFATVVAEHLGGPIGDMAIVGEEVPNHRYADWDTALGLLAAADPDGREVGVSGGEMRFHHSLSDFVGAAFVRFGVGQVDYVSLPVGHDERRRAIGFGVRLFRYKGEPVGVLQRQANRRFGQEYGSVEVICADRDLATALVEEARGLATEHSVLRGQVVTFDETGYGDESGGMSFLARPEVTADQVILPADSLARIVQHVTGIAEHAALLRRHGQHLKRGLLLYGPPGTGKTHTVRHVIHRSPGHTVIVLAGAALRFVSLAAAVARHLQPAIVVLEDCDLVAEDRSFGAGPKPLLFEVLDAMDGLDADADVTFLLTTNRVETLERALVERPGRIDLAVEIPLPDPSGRRRLLELYAGDIAYSDVALADAARRTEGVTASFAKELMRRAVLEAAVAGEEPGDAHLTRALDTLMGERETTTRALLGHAGAAPLGFGGAQPGVHR